MLQDIGTGGITQEQFALVRPGMTQGHLMTSDVQELVPTQHDGPCLVLIA